MQTWKFIAFYCPTCHILNVGGNLKTKFTSLTQHIFCLHIHFLQLSNGRTDGYRSDHLVEESSEKNGSFSWLTRANEKQYKQITIQLLDGQLFRLAPWKGRGFWWLIKIWFIGMFLQSALCFCSIEDKIESRQHHVNTMRLAAFLKTI